MLVRDVAQGINPLGVVVEAGNVMKHFATGMQKGFACLHVNFFQRFQAVAGKAGADNIDPFDAGLAHGNQRGLGVGLQPLGATQARLKSDLVLVFV